MSNNKYNKRRVFLSMNKMIKCIQKSNNTNYHHYNKKLLYNKTHLKMKTSKNQQNKK